MVRAIQVGVIGAGANTKLHHIPKLQAISGVHVVGVTNRTRASGDRVADAFAIPQVYANWHEMLEDDVIDAIVIGTWPYTHCEMTCAALDAGKHVLCEARMAMNAAEARRMLATANAHPDLTAQVVPSPFTLRFDRTIRRLITESYVGELYAIDVHGTLGEFAEPDAPMTWRQDTALSGLNCLTLGIWYEALARWVGHADRVCAFSRTCIQERTDEAGRRITIGIPDHMDVLADMVCGAQAHLRFSAVTGLAPAPWSVFLYGKEGTLLLDADGGKLFGAKRGDDGFAEIVIPADEAQSWRVEEEFIAAIRGDEEIRLTTFTEGVRYMEFTEAVARSAQSRSAVHLPLGEE